MMDPSLAAQDVLAERKRQVDVEGWTPEHDDMHARFEMAKAAACYAWSASLPSILRAALTTPQSGWNEAVIMKRLWPWSYEWWKPKDRRSDLVRAAALIIAEIERLDRAAAKVEAEITPTDIEPSPDDASLNQGT